MAVCNCKHEVGGTCRRFPPVPVIEMGRTAWRFPSALAECGERAALSPEATEDEAKPAKVQKPASNAARKAQTAKKQGVKADGKAKGEANGSV